MPTRQASFFLGAFVALFLAAPITAQQGTITGRVLDADDQAYWLNQAEVIKHWAKQSGLSIDIINDAAEFKIDAEHKAGTLLAGMAKAKGTARTPTVRRSHDGTT